MQPRRMMDQESRGAPYGVLLVVVVAFLLVVPSLLGDQGEALAGYFQELTSPLVLLLLPILLLLTIQYLSSGCGSSTSGICSTGGPESIHRVSGSPVGVAMFLVLVLLLLYSRVSIFGGDDDSDE